jgi:hypothetical protein
MAMLKPTSLDGSASADLPVISARPKSHEQILPIEYHQAAAKAKANIAKVLQ